MKHGSNTDKSLSSALVHVPSVARLVVGHRAQGRGGVGPQLHLVEDGGLGGVVVGGFRFQGDDLLLVEVEQVVLSDERVRGVLPHAPRILKVSTLGRGSSGHIPALFPRDPPDVILQRPEPRELPER